MTVFCSEQGITHHFTAPYTLAHNGRAERLHRTLFEKAQTMRIACEAPPSMWDEFCATAAFLTNLSATASLNGRTPYERWFNRVPSLSQLRKIGCLAFALVPVSQPKTPHPLRPLHHDRLWLRHQSILPLGSHIQSHLQLIPCHIH
jgi:transposase InsO family protein